LRRSDALSADGHDPSGGSSTSDQGASSTSSSGESTSDSADESSTSLTWPPDDGITQCIRGCDGPFDCCPAGSEGSCPGPYPWNLDCIDGLCVPGQCTSDADCATADPAQACRAVDGLQICVTLCGDDPTVCTQPNTGLACSGATDEGDAYCFESCDSAGVFCGNGSCDAESGRCVCRDGGQCLNGWVCA
jgi:hypothetical protein